MSELTTVARPYAKAAFDFAVEKDAIAKWQEMLAFAGEVAANEDMHQLLTGAVAADTGERDKIPKIANRKSQKKFPQ